MFAKEVYIQRRHELKSKVQSGIILFLGNEESPMNYPDNGYHYRQDSTFLYFWGLNYPSLAAIIDLDENKEIVYGNDFTIDQIVWMGPQPTIKELSEKCGVVHTGTPDHLQEKLRTAILQGRKIHFSPQYRADNKLKMESLLGIRARVINQYVSEEYVKAAVSMRSIKSDIEIREIEKAVNITGMMHKLAMKLTKPGIYEREVAGAIEGVAISAGGNVGYPVIFSIHGETLHNHYHGNMMKAGDIVVNDSGAETDMRYNGDITRTIPVSGKFTERQKEIYQIVYNTHENSMKQVKAGVKFKDIHLFSCKSTFEGLKSLGILKGNADDAIEAGAYGIFFQCGLGHMMGMDVHDMEDLGERYVGYDENVERSKQFGLCYLRLAKELQPGFVITVEPGVYFIPQLIDRWRAEKKYTDFINYDRLEEYKNFGGIRIEDNLVVTETGHRILGEHIPKTISEVEEMCSQE